MSHENFNPSGWAVKNGNFIGLPYTVEEAKIILLPVPWEATVSYGGGTAQGPEAIREASYQLDLYDYDYPEAWKVGLHLLPSDEDLLARSEQARLLAVSHIDSLESGGEGNEAARQAVNAHSAYLNNWVYEQAKSWLDQGKFVGLVGGDHSTPLGYIKALGERHANLGILHIDAHADLREAYEGFTYSHASIFYNTLKEVPSVHKIVQVGIRDYCQEEVEVAEQSGGRVDIFFDHEIKRNLYAGKHFGQICEDIVSRLPHDVYISFDIDALDPKLCPGTGTPVAGGLELQEAFFLCRKVVDSGRRIVGFDLNEVGTSEWDGNVGARVLYKLANLMALSQGLGV